jgi:tryptophan synthase beta chain
MTSYDRYFRGELEDYAYPEAEIHRALEGLDRAE